MRCGRDYFLADEDRTQPFNAGIVITKGKIMAHCIAPIVSTSHRERGADDQAAGFHFGSGEKPNELKDGLALCRS